MIEGKRPLAGKTKLKYRESTILVLNLSGHGPMTRVSEQLPVALHLPLWRLRTTSWFSQLGVVLKCASNSLQFTTLTVTPGLIFPPSCASGYISVTKKGLGPGGDDLSRHRKLWKTHRNTDPDPPCLIYISRTLCICTCRSGVDFNRRHCHRGGSSLNRLITRSTAFTSRYGLMSA